MVNVVKVFCFTINFSCFITMSSRLDNFMICRLFIETKGYFVVIQMEIIYYDIKFWLKYEDYIEICLSAVLAKRKFVQHRYSVNKIFTYW